MGSALSGKLAEAGEIINNSWLLKKTSEPSIGVRTFATDLTMSPIALKFAGSIARDKYSGEVIQDQGPNYCLWSIPHCELAGDLASSPLYRVSVRSSYIIYII